MRSSPSVVRCNPPRSEVLPHWGVYCRCQELRTIGARSCAQGLGLGSFSLVGTPRGNASRLAGWGIPRSTSVPSTPPRKVATPCAPRSDGLDSILNVRNHMMPCCARRIQSVLVKSPQDFEVILGFCSSWLPCGGDVRLNPSHSWVGNERASRLPAVLSRMSHFRRRNARKPALCRGRIALQQAENAARPKPGGADKTPAKS